MTAATPSHHALARWLVSAELGDAEGAVGTHTAVERVFHKLSHRVARLITPVGCEALLARAVHLSRASFPFLEGIQVTHSTDAVTLRLGDSATGVAPNETCEGFVAVLGSLIALLVSFIGDDLTSRLLCEDWPNLPMVQPVHPIRRNGTVNVEMTP